MNREEAKELLLPYRHGTDDAGDPEVAQALAFAKTDPELGRWLEEHCARQYVIREKFRQISAPDGLMQQIISEHAATQRAGLLKKNRALLALVPAVILLIGAYFYWQHQPGEDTQLADLQSQMTLVMSSGYPMELATNNVSSINDYLKQKDAPADFALSEPLKHATLTGCAIENWHDRKVSLVCFHTGTDTNASASDTWLFVANRKQVSDAPDSSTPQVSQVNKLAIATWVDGDKLYILGRTGNTADLKKYL